MSSEGKIVIALIVGLMTGGFIGEVYNRDGMEETKERYVDMYFGECKRFVDGAFTMTYHKGKYMVRCR